MEGLVLTTIDQLREIITESVRTEFARQNQTVAPEQEPETKQDLITRKEAAKLLGISLPTLNEWTKTGLVVGYRISTRVRYKQSELINGVKKINTGKK